MDVGTPHQLLPELLRKEGHMATITAQSALDILTGRDEELRWVASFTVRGRTYTMRPGVASFGQGFGQFSVWNAAGKPVSVKVRETDAVVVLTRFLVGACGAEVPATV